MNPIAVTSQLLQMDAIVGLVSTSGGFGAIWDQQGNIYKANDLLAPGFSTWNVTQLLGINDYGWLTGEAVPPGSGYSHAVLLRPKNPLPFIAAGAEMINCAFKLDPQWPRHLSRLLVLWQNVKIYRGVAQMGYLSCRAQPRHLLL